MKIVVEKSGGLLQSLIDAAFDQPEIKGKATTVLDELLHPHTTQDLYDGVVYTLRKNKGNDRSGIVQERVMPLFFPENQYSKDAGNGKIKVSEVHPKLYAMYKNKLEDCIIEYITTDAMDIIKRVQQSYLQDDPNYDTSQISGDIYFGSIANDKQINQYTLRSDMKKLYQEFLVKKDQTQWYYEGSYDEVRQGLRSLEFTDEEIDNALKHIRITDKMNTSAIIRAATAYIGRQRDADNR